MKIEVISPEFMLERCFMQFQSIVGVPALEEGRELSFSHMGLSLYFPQSSNVKKKQKTQ
jgi:hypothetical protein